MVSFALHQLPNTQHINDTYLRHLFRLVPVSFISSAYCDIALPSHHFRITRSPDLLELQNFCLGDTIFWMSIRTFLDWGKWDPGKIRFADSIHPYCVMPIDESRVASRLLPRLFRNSLSLPLHLQHRCVWL